MQMAGDLTGRPSPVSTRLTEKVRTVASGALVRLYWRICRAPSASSTCTETYWPARNAGAGRPSAGRIRKVTTSAVSRVRSITSHCRQVPPASTPCSAYSRRSVSIRELAISQ